MQSRHALALAVVVALTPTISGSWRWSESSRVPSSISLADITMMSLNNSIIASAHASLLPIFASRLAAGVPWSTVSREVSSTPLRYASAEIALAFDRTIASSISTGRRARFDDIRVALGVDIAPEALPCRMKATEVKLDGQLWYQQRELLERHPELMDASDSVQLLVEIDALASNPEESGGLASLAKKLFDCDGRPDDAALRGAAVLAFLVAAAREPTAEDIVDHLFYSEVWAENPAGRKAERPRTPPRARRKPKPVRAMIAMSDEGIERRQALWRIERASLGEDGDSIDTSVRPKICLAMSGGGVRSAAFQMGVLQGLAELQLLDDVDVASAVSGGSYALAWLVSDADHQHMLLDERDLVKLEKRNAWLTTTAEGAVGALGSILTTPLRVLARLLHTSIPDPTLAHFYYARLLRSSFALPAKPLAHFQSEASLFPIFASTVRAGNTGPCDESESERSKGENLEISVFEITPLAGGSVGMGFSTSLPRDLSLASTVATAGAALDSPATKPCGILRAAGITLGTHVGRWRPDAVDARRTSSSAERRSDRDSIFLSDGAFSDNLGIYPLLARSCERIIVADAGSDPDLVFGDYHRLQRNTADRVSIKSEIDAFVPPKVEAVTKTDANSRRPQFAARNASQAVFTGTIQIGNTSIPFTYLKLAIDETKRDYPPAVRQALKKQSFPQIPTSIQRLRPAEFRGLRHLGRYLTLQALSSSH